jgi:Threonine dehydrogenase and related Zn-dependent dehydrogenases
MKAYAALGNGKRGFIDIPTPEPTDYEALVKVEACGICAGTDTKIIHGKFKGVDNYPAVLGHEGVGRVVRVGSKVHSFKIGDLVMMPYLGTTPAGIFSAWGTFSEYNTVCDARAMEADGFIPPEFAWGQSLLPSYTDIPGAVMMITFREVLSTMELFGFSHNKSLVVFGLGPVGQTFVRFAKLCGMSPVIAVGRSDAKLAAAAENGADYIIDTRVTPIAEGVHAICPGGVDFALDAAGVNAFISDALSFIAPGGKICIYGISPDTSVFFDLSACPYNFTLQYNQFPSKRMEGEALARILAWTRFGALDPRKFISDIIPFERIGEGYDLVESGKASGKIVVTLS